MPLVWDHDKAEQLQRDANAIEKHEDLSEFLRKKPYWTELIALFQHWSYGKCWYTEAKPLEHGGTFEIDHFRPKLGARDPWNERPEWEGYPWLAYEWTNFRLSAPIANRLGDDVHGNASGKGVQFPLRSAASPIARCHEELVHESAHVMLIDPCEFDQVNDLSFAEDGMVTCTCSNDLFRRARVERTVNVYNLDHPGLCSARSEVWRSCQSIVALVGRLERLEEIAAPGLLTSLITEQRENLSRKFCADQEYAGTARAFARTRGEEWVRVASQNVRAPAYKPFASVSARLVANDDGEVVAPLQRDLDEDSGRTHTASGSSFQLAFSFMSELVAPISARPKAPPKRKVAPVVLKPKSRPKPRSKKSPSK